MKILTDGQPDRQSGIKSRVAGDQKHSKTRCADHPRFDKFNNDGNHLKDPETLYNCLMFYTSIISV